jgi:hypothetical protein
MSVPVNEEHRINMVMKVKGWIRHNQPNLFNFLTNSNKREQEYGHRIGGDGTKLLSEKQYDKIHRQMRIKKGHPDHCERCGKKSYNYDLANIDHQYSNSVADYNYWCKSCHVKHDYAQGFRLSSQNIKESAKKFEFQ